MSRLFVVLLLMPVVAHAATGWICTEDAATGFQWSGGRWVPTHFSAKGKYVVAPPTKEDREMWKTLKSQGMQVGELGDYVVKISGLEVPIYWSCPATKIRLNCDYDGFVISTKDMRFRRLSDTPYWGNGNALKSLDLVMSIGGCTPF